MSRTTAVDLTLVVGIAGCATIAILGLTCTLAGTWAVFVLGLVVVAIACAVSVAIVWTVALITDR